MTAPLKVSTQRAHAVSLFALFAVGCMAPSPRSAGDEIDLTGESAVTHESPEPPIPAPKPETCKKDDAGCQRVPAASEDSAEPLDPSKSYGVALLSTDPRRGPPDARVTLVVFSDFQCPFCRHLELTLAELALRHPNDVQIVWKDMPLESHVFARPAALLAREAQAKGGNALFWQVHATLYGKQPVLGEASLAEVAAQFGLHWPPLERFGSLLDAGYAQGVALNIQATPTTFINGRPLVGALPLEALEQRVQAELAGAQ